MITPLHGRFQIFFFFFFIDDPSISEKNNKTHTIIIIIIIIDVRSSIPECLEGRVPINQSNWSNKKIEQ